MGAYISGRDLLGENGDFAGLIPSDDLAELSEAALDNLLAAGKEMIDAYCQQSFGEDKESIEDYSYDNNLNAFSNILSRLNFLKVGDETICGRRKSIRAKVI